MRKTSLLIVLCTFFIFKGANAQIITTVAGTSGGYSGDGGPATAAQIRIPVGVVTDNAGNIYFSEQNNYVIRKVNSLGVISTYAGTGTPGYSGDNGPATAAKLKNPQGVTIDKYGDLYIADLGNLRVRKVKASSGVITTFAGNGTNIVSGDGGPATAAGLGNSVAAVAFDTSGEVLYIGGGYNIYKVGTDGIIHHIAGRGVLGYSGESALADTSKLSSAIQIVFNANNELFFADGGNYRVRKIDNSGMITTVVGNGLQGYSGDDSAATSARLKGPGGVWVDSCGDIYVSDQGSHTIRFVDPLGKIHTLAGTGGAGGYSGDGGPSIASKLNRPTNIFLDKNNDLYIADQENCRIRKIAMPRCDSVEFPVVSVGEVNSGVFNVVIFPNPSDGALTVKASAGHNEQVHLSIVNMVGALVREYNIPSNKETPLRTNLPSGMYMLIAETVRGRVVEKFVVR